MPTFHFSRTTIVRDYAERLNIIYGRLQTTGDYAERFFCEYYAQQGGTSGRLRRTFFCEDYAQPANDVLYIHLIVLVLGF